MKHLYVQGQSQEAPTLLLLHGTGGNERDLLPIAEIIAPHASVLGVKGNVLENGMPRFFRRLAEGVFDEADLLFRTQELHEFLDESAIQYGFDRNRVVAIGYSNGANIAASLIYHHLQPISGAILFHAMVPRYGVTIPELNGIPIFVGAGMRDPLIIPSQTKELVEHLHAAGASVTEFWTEGGHQLSMQEVEQAKAWFVDHFS